MTAPAFSDKARLTADPTCVVEQQQLQVQRGGETMRNKIEQHKKRGQGLVEYALILVLIAIVVILILTFLGNQVNNTFSKVGSAMNP
jgi:pilus assembly protein Flp/PilA